MEPVGRPATDLAAAVRAGEVTAVEVARAHLDHLAAVEHRLGAFVAVRRRAALEDAEAVDAHPDRSSLPLAGVPVAVQDVVDVKGEPTRYGSRAVSADAASAADELVVRLQDAGAIVVGKTRTPEFELWATSDDPDGVAISPWDPTRSAGGSAGGAAAAVAAGVAPLALAADGLGSVRIPAAACGTVGLKPGAPLLPKMRRGEHHWFGLGRFGPIATTVADAALMLDVLAGTTHHRSVAPVDRRLKVAVSWATALPTLVSRAWIEAAIEGGRLFNHAGHEVVHANPPYDQQLVRGGMSRWLAAAAADVEALDADPERLQARTRSHMTSADRAAPVLQVREEDAEHARERLLPFLDEHDVVVTPTLTRTQGAAVPWHERSWTANAASTIPAATYAGPWNLADLPVAAVPVWHDDGRPLSVQVVGGPGREELVLAVAAQLEQLAPWTRHAPGWGVPVGSGS